MMEETTKAEDNPPPLESKQIPNENTQNSNETVDAAQLSEYIEDETFTQSLVPSLQQDTRALQEQLAIFKERTAKCESRITADKWDTEAWTNLIVEAQAKDIEIARDVYERFLAVFPTAGRYWKYYAEHEMAANNFDNVERIFSRCLLKCLNIDLWKSYVNYIQTNKQHLPDGRDQVIKAYEFALEKMGMDINSTPIWTDYIAFLKEAKPKNQYEEGQKISALRKIYQRAIESPIHNLEVIWREYDAFENDLNKTLAKALLNEHAGRYMQARSIYRERKRYYEGILRNMLARPPSTGANKEEHQISLWKRLIVYEKTNPQKLDTPGLRNRLVFTYNQCLICLYHYPEIWFDFAADEAAGGHFDDAIAIYERSLEALPDSLILYFAYANMLESQKNYKGAKEIYERLVTRIPEPLPFIQYMKFTQRTEDIKAARLVFKRARTAPSCTHHVYTAAALMEWQINKDTQIARNVFDLGMNKYGREPSFVLEYIKFLIHLNEENNLRVLFERAVTDIPKEKAQEIWNLYLAFEYNYGDLNTISKIESRKATLYPELHLSGILSLVHRYRYLDMWPCSTVELDTFGRTVSLREEISTGSSKADDDASSDPLRSSRFNPKLARLPRPDLSQLTVFKPEMGNMLLLPANSTGGPMIPAPGGGSVTNAGPVVNANVQLPEIIVQLILNLPSAAAYQGPIPDADQLLLMLKDTPLPPPPAGDTTKKRSKGDDEDDEDEEDQTQQTGNLPPVNDLFRQRQAAKLSRRF